MVAPTGRIEGRRAVPDAVSIEGEHLAATQALIGLVGTGGDAVPMVQVAGPEGGEGTSTVAFSLAAAVARSTGIAVQHVTFADGARRGGASEGVGIDGVRRTVLPIQAIRRIVTEGLASQIDLRSGRTGLVVVETPPLLTTVEGAAIGGQVAGTVLVVEADRTTYAAIRAARDAVERSGGQVLGVVLNKRRYDVPGAVARALGIPASRLGRSPLRTFLLAVLAALLLVAAAFLVLAPSQPEPGAGVPDGDAVPRVDEP